jgi:hypothetical protein
MCYGMSLGMCLYIYQSRHHIYLYIYKSCDKSFCNRLYMGFDNNILNMCYCNSPYKCFCSL